MTATKIFMLLNFKFKGNKEEFRRAFASAIVHVLIKIFNEFILIKLIVPLKDVFNFLSVLILLPLELISHYSEIISGAILRTVEYDSSVKEPELLTAITKPLTQKIVQLDKVVLDLLAQNKTKGGK
jgi:sodium-dependent phosphate cotransporter